MLHCMECVGESRAPVGTWHRFLHNKGTSKILNTLRARRRWLLNKPLEILRSAVPENTAGKSRRTE